MSDKMYWHFLPDDGILANGDGRKVVVGETLRIEGEPVLCDHGFHASERIIDALQYAPGALVCRVKLGGKITEGDDKVAAQERTVVWMYDATRVLHEFTLWCAEEALKLIDKPDPRSVEALRVKRLLLDGNATDDELAPAIDAARDAARAARDAALAAGAAAIDAAIDAARAAGAAAWAARAAARDAAWDAAWDAQNIKLEQMIMEAKLDED